MSNFSKLVHVLIVDDLPQNCHLLSIYCEKFGLSFEIVTSGRAAVAAAEARFFDVILMDVLMPGMDGMAAAIRALPGAIAKVPIVAVTPAASPGETVRYLACGMTAVVAKPIDPAQLKSTLQAVIANRTVAVDPSRLRRRAVS